MNVAIRADASLLMGTGHVMRCLTLADMLSNYGFTCDFICREHTGNLIEYIRNKGYKVYTLPMRVKDLGTNQVNELEPKKKYIDWLGSSQEDDANDCALHLKKLKPYLLLVDHYSLDSIWESMLSGYYQQLMVIDDLANRSHICNLLLDQNLGQSDKLYEQLVPKSCQTLVGPKFALLRPEFFKYRQESLSNRKHPKIKNILISMGGIDKTNATGLVLESLKQLQFDDDIKLTVIMGGNAPWIQRISEVANQMPWPTEVLVNCRDIASKMSQSDIIIGAAGSTSWERCCLGIPSLVVCLADNQRQVLAAMEKAEIAVTLDIELLEQQGALILQNKLEQLKTNMALISHKAAVITDGTGAQLVADLIMERYEDDITNRN